MFSRIVYHIIVIVYLCIFFAISLAENSAFLRWRRDWQPAMYKYNKEAEFYPNQQEICCEMCFHHSACHATAHCFHHGSHETSRDNTPKRGETLCEQKPPGYQKNTTDGEKHHGPWPDPHPSSRSRSSMSWSHGRDLYPWSFGTWIFCKVHQFFSLDDASSTMGSI